MVASLATNLFTFSCDSLRPIIFFATFLAIKLVAFGLLVLSPAHRRLELLPPHFLSGI